MSVLNNINKPTEPKINHLIAYCGTAGVGVISTGLMNENHLIAYAGLFLVGFPIIAVFLPSKL